MKISKTELLKKYGIELPVGKFAITNDGKQYTINSVKDDTEGCILVGSRKTATGIAGCAPMVDAVIGLIDNAQGQCTIEIR
jgi:hypothetical protein